MKPSVRRFLVVPFGIRGQMLLLSTFLFSIPWLGYQYVWEMEKYLREGQEKTLMATARAVATALHERPKLFDTQASFLSKVKTGRDLYAYEFVDPIQLDGKVGDWQVHLAHLMAYDEEHLIERYAEDQASVAFRHLIGRYGDYLYAWFQIDDDRVVYRSPDSLTVHRNDHIQIALANPSGEFHRYVLAALAPGWVNPFRVTGEEMSPVGPETRIQGHWRQTDSGYNVELRIPLSLVGSKLAFAVTDVDDPATRAPLVVIGTADTGDVARLGTVLVPSPEIERIIRGLGRTTSKIWVVDQHKRVIAESGEIEGSGGIWSEQETRPSDTAWSWFEETILHPLYYLVLTRPPRHFVDQLVNAAEFEGEHIEAALAGYPRFQWRLTADRQVVVLSAAYPIWIADKVMGAVAVEETTNGIRTLRNRALEGLFNVILATLILGTLALFVFASRVSSRIKRLRDDAEAAIDAQGRVRTQLEGSSARDEIGDLSRGFAHVVDRLSQHHQYLEKLASRLSHELRTPITVVRSSLDNLAMRGLDADATVYVDRAQEGVGRLAAILANMSEATRLEQSLDVTEKEDFDLGPVVSGCVEGYRLAYPDIGFQLHAAADDLAVAGVPELIAQLLDKLVANAVEFSDGEQDVVIRLYRRHDLATLKVVNSGRYLPDAMGEKVFDSMVSVRSESAREVPHLGLGLHIARLIAEYHEGTITIVDREDVEGVVVTVEIPLA